MKRTCPTCGATLADHGLAGHCPACLFALGLTPAGEDAANGPDQEPPAGVLAAPPGFDDYELLESLGHGGMGVVYRARQKSLNRVVALKMVRGIETASPRLLARFHLESQAAARLDHPNIIPIYETGEHDGQPWFSMKLVDGGSLAKALADPESRFTHHASRTSQDVKRRDVIRENLIATLLASISRAVHYAHQRGVLHRDLKPANILLDSDGAPYLTDFGIAKLLQEGMDLTRTIELLGTPSYMAPEIAAGQSASVASDVYSLGAILYELLTGHPPFTAATPMETLRQAAEEEPKRPTTINLAIPRDLETICLKCLRKDPARRYPSALALAEDLEHFLRDEPITARRVTWRDRLWRWCRRKPALAAALAGLLLVFAVGLAGVLTQWQQARIHQAAAERALAQSQDHLWRAEFERAHAWRISGQMGQRVQALAAIRNAAAIRPAPELRTEAIAAFALTDLEDSGTWHPVPPDAVNVEVDGVCERFAFWTPDGRIEVRRFADGSLVAALTNLVRFGRIQLNRDGTRLASFGDEGGFVWDIKSQRVIHETRERCCLSFSPDDKQLLVASRQGGARVLESATQEEIARLALPFEPVHAAFSPQGDLIAFWHRPFVTIWNLRTQRKSAELKMPADVMNFAWNPDGTILAFGCHYRRVHVWAWAEGSPLELQGHTRASVMVYYHPDGDLLASTSSDETLRLWEPHAGLPLLMTLSTQPKGFSADGQWLAVSSPRGLGRLRLHRPAECRVLHSRLGEGQGANGLDFSPTGQWLVGRDLDGCTVWNTAQARKAWRGRVSDPEGGAFFLNTRSLLLADGREMQLWTNAGPDEAWQPVLASTLLRFEDRVAYSALSHDKRQIVLKVKGTGVVADLPTGPKDLAPRTNAPVTAPLSPSLPITEPRARLAGQPLMAGFAFSADGQWIASGCWNNAGDYGSSLCLWSARDGQLLRRIPSGNCNPFFSPDGQWFLLAGAKDYRFFRVTGPPDRWQEEWRESLGVLPSWVPGLAGFAYHRPWVALVDRGQVVRLLDVPSRRELARLTPLAPQTGHLAWSADGRWFAASTQFGVHLWDLRLTRARLRPLGLDWDNAELPPLPR